MHIPIPRGLQSDADHHSGSRPEGKGERDPFRNDSVESKHMAMVFRASKVGLIHPSGSWGIGRCGGTNCATAACAPILPTMASAATRARATGWDAAQRAETCTSFALALSDWSEELRII